jgi:hypothetical protein
VRRPDFIPVDPTKYLYAFPVVRGVEFDKYLDPRMITIG